MKNNLIIALTAISITVLLWHSCKKEDNCLACEPCEEYITKTNTRIIYEMPNQEFRPCFNPNNNNEFVFIKKRNEIYSLAKYDIAQSKETILLEDIIAERPIWGKNNTIVFTHDPYNNFYTYNVNTKEFKVFGKDGYKYVEPQWKNDSIVAVNITPKDGFAKETYYGEFNILSKTQDTAKANFTHFSINSIGELCFGNYPTLKYKRGENTYDLCEVPNLLFSTWHPNNDDIYFSNIPSLFKVNKHTKKVIQIKNGCSSKAYLVFTISPDGKKIITERKKIWDEASDPVHIPHHDVSLWIMNIDGTDEQPVLIPE